MQIIQFLGRNAFVENPLLSQFASKQASSLAALYYLYGEDLELVSGGILLGLGLGAEQLADLLSFLSSVGPYS